MTSTSTPASEHPTGREHAVAGAAGNLRWGFIGSGKMATALVQGMLRAGVASADSILASDPSEAARSALAAEAGISVLEANAPVVQGSNVLVLAVKPQAMGRVLIELNPLVTPGHLVISIAAGIPLSAMAAGLGSSPRLARVMPNTPALVGEGASAYALASGVPREDEVVVQSLLKAVGRSVRVPESLLDAVTGLSGSGPAFVYLFVEALSDGGVRAGLPRDIATMLAAQTVLGAARMVLETGLHPGALKDQVTSPGGTTIAGLHALERGGVRGAVMDAVDAAARRSAELAASAEPARPPRSQAGP